jgi:hypothetical protein
MDARETLTTQTTISYWCSWFSLREPKGPFLAILISILGLGIGLLIGWWIG